MDVVTIALVVSVVSLAVSVLVATGVIPVHQKSVLSGGGTDRIERPADALEDSDIAKFKAYDDRIDTALAFGTRISALETKTGTTTASSLSAAQVSNLKKLSSKVDSLLGLDARVAKFENIPFMRTDKQYEIFDARGKYTLMSSGPDNNFNGDSTDSAQWADTSQLGGKAHLQVKFNPYPS